MKKPEKPSNQPQYHCHNFGATTSLQEILDYTQNFKVPANEILIESYYDYTGVEVSFYIKPLSEEEFKKQLDQYKKDLKEYNKWLKQNENTLKEKERLEAEKAALELRITELQDKIFNKPPKTPSEQRKGSGQPKTPKTP